MLVSDLDDKVVYSKNMVLLGKIRDLEIDPSDMKLTHLVVEVDKEIAKDILGKHFVIRHAKGRVPAQLIESIKDAVILKQPIDGLKGAIESL